MSEANFNPNDLSNGHYPHLRRLAVDDPEFLDIQFWLTAKGAPRFSRFFVPKGLGLGGDNLILPTEMWWEGAPGEAGGALKLDATLVFNFPHVALVELKKAFGFGDRNILEMYPGYRKPLPLVIPAVIGAHWPERGANAYRPHEANPRAEGFNPGDTYRDATGSYIFTRERSLFSSVPVWRKAP